MTIRLKGGPELLRLLDELPKNLERNVIFWIAMPNYLS